MKLKFDLSCLLVVLSVVCFHSDITHCDVPADIQKCRYKDSNCIAAAAQYVVQNYAKTGVREMHLIPFDPLRIKSLKLDKNPSSPVSITLKLNDVDLIGLHDTQVLKLSGFDVDLKNIIEFNVHIPRLVLKGPYTIDGSILVLPIVGKGDCEFVLDDTEVYAKLKLKGLTKAGLRYAEVDQVKFSLKPKHVSYRMGGLFNNNKELSDNMHAVLNENWNDVFTELEPDLAQAIGLIIKQLLNNFLLEQPYEEMFID